MTIRPRPRPPLLGPLSSPGNESSRSRPPSGRAGSVCPCRIAWGIALIAYASRVRKHLQYTFTDERLLVETYGEIDAVPLEESSRIRAGVSPLESIITRGNVTF